MTPQCHPNDIVMRDVLSIMMSKVKQGEWTMNQPELGIAIADLRTQKGMTQEKLAEYCEVSKRTIQRIENGEVEPRAFTLNNLSNIFEFDFLGKNTNNEAIWLTALHLSSAFSTVLVPLWIWSWKKNHSYKINQHGRQVLNFQITVILILFAALFFFFIMLAGAVFLEKNSQGGGDIIYTIMVILGMLPIPVMGIFSVFQGVINASRALSDKPIHYRFSIPFVK